MKKIALSLVVISSSFCGGLVFSGEIGTTIESNKWTGFYLGGNIGGSWSDPSVNVKTVNSFIDPNISVHGRTTALSSVIASSGIIPLHSSGAVGGIQFGYNYQIATQYLAGFDADIQAIDSHHKGSLIQITPRIGFAPNTVTANLAGSYRAKYVGTVRGRWGVLLPNNNPWLAYFTGGLAYGGIQSSSSINGGETPILNTSNFTGSGSISTTRTGYVVGGGLEKFVASKWSAKIEYLYYDLGTVNYSNGELNSYGVNSGILRYINTSSSSLRFNGNIVRLGVSFHFA